MLDPPPPPPPPPPRKARKANQLPAKRLAPGGGLTVAKSTPYRYSKLLAEHTDLVLFEEHPYSHYVVGALIMGLFIHRS